MVFCLMTNIKSSIRLITFCDRAPITFFFVPTHNPPNSAGGGNRCSLRRRFLRLPWCAQGYNERQSEKMLSSYVVRFFRLPPLRNTAAALRCPATLAPQAPLARLQRAFASPRPAAFVAPCSLGAFLSPPEPPSGSRTSQLISGGRRAPFVLRPCLRVRPAVPLVVR